MMNMGTTLANILVGTAGTEMMDRVLMLLSQMHCLAATTDTAQDTVSTILSKKLWAKRTLEPSAHR